MKIKYLIQRTKNKSEHYVIKYILQDFDMRDKNKTKNLMTF